MESVRVGTIFAHDAKQYRKWSSRSKHNDRGRGLTGAALEQAIMGLARVHPEYVVVGA